MPPLSAEDRVDQGVMPAIRWSYPRRVLFAAAVVVADVLPWQLADVLVLTFGAIVVAAIVRGLARHLEPASCSASLA